MLASDMPRTVDEAELAGWTGLELDCEGCRILTYITWPEIRRRSGYRKLDEIKERLVCRRCRGKPVTVCLHRSVVDMPKGTPRPERLEI